MLDHVCLLKFAPTTTTEQKDKLIAMCLDLRNTIHGIIDYQANYIFNSEDDYGFEIGITVRFESKEALANYTVHPDHQAVLAYLGEINLVDKTVCDFELV